MGPYEKPAWAIYDAANAIASLVNQLINEYFALNIFLYRLKVANTTPLFKKGDTEDAINLRLNSITPALVKVFEIFFKKRRFQKKTTRTQTDKKSAGCECFFYLFKAFDSTDHNFLLEKNAILRRL